MVTLVFTEVEGGIGLWEADPGVLAEVSARHNRAGSGGGVWCGAVAG